MCRGLNTSSDTFKQPESPKASHGDIICIISYKKGVNHTNKCKTEKTTHLQPHFHLHHHCLLHVQVPSLSLALFLSPSPPPPLSLACPLTHPCLLEHPHLPADPPDFKAKSPGPHLVHHFGTRNNS